jgi:hypothetical protein
MPFLSISLKLVEGRGPYGERGIEFNGEVRDGLAKVAVAVHHLARWATLACNVQ